MQAETTQQEAALPPGTMTPAELALFTDMRKRLAPAFQAIVDLEAWTHGLTPAEERILNLILDGHQHKDVAVIAGINEKTSKSHAAAIMRKFNVTSRAQLTAVLFRRKR
jgi:DNA-binding CsgD family transcriptional regulator